MPSKKQFYRRNKMMALPLGLALLVPAFGLLIDKFRNSDKPGTVGLLPQIQVTNHDLAAIKTTASEKSNDEDLKEKIEKKYIKDEFLRIEALPTPIDGDSYLIADNENNWVDIDTYNIVSHADGRITIEADRIHRDYENKGSEEAYTHFIVETDDQVYLSEYYDPDNSCQAWQAVFARPSARIRVTSASSLYSHELLLECAYDEVERRYDFVEIEAYRIVDLP
jgi:hypothetical protein